MAIIATLINLTVLSVTIAGHGGVSVELYWHVHCLGYSKFYPEVKGYRTADQPQGDILALERWIEPAAVPYQVGKPCRQSGKTPLDPSQCTICHWMWSLGIRPTTWLTFNRLSLLKNPSNGPYLYWSLVVSISKYSQGEELWGLIRIGFPNGSNCISNCMRVGYYIFDTEMVSYGRHPHWLSGTHIYGSNMFQTNDPRE